MNIYAGSIQITDEPLALGTDPIPAKYYYDPDWFELVVREQCDFKYAVALSDPASTGETSIAKFARSGGGQFWLHRLEERYEQGTQKRGQPCDEQPQIVPSCDEDGVDGIAGGTGEVIALEQAIALGVTDNRFDGVAAAELAFDRR